jgi:hypothetical protein
MTELSSTLIGRGLVQSLSRSSLRTQGPITPGTESEKRPLLECRSESLRRMGPCVRRDDLLENSIRDGPAHKEGGNKQRGLFENRIGNLRQQHVNLPVTSFVYVSPTISLCAAAAFARGELLPGQRPASPSARPRSRSRSCPGKPSFMSVSPTIPGPQPCGSRSPTARTRPISPWSMTSTVRRRAPARPMRRRGLSRFPPLARCPRR